MKKTGSSDLVAKLVQFGIPTLAFLGGMAWNGFHIAEQLATKNDVRLAVDESVKAQNEKFAQIHQEILQSAAAIDARMKTSKEEFERYSDGNRKGLKTEVDGQITAINEKFEKAHTEQTAFQARTTAALESLSKSVDGLVDTIKFWAREQGPAPRRPAR